MKFDVWNKFNQVINKARETINHKQKINNENEKEIIDGKLFIQLVKNDLLWRRK
jgi:hypothetical protein